MFITEFYREVGWYTEQILNLFLVFKSVQRGRHASVDHITDMINNVTTVEFCDSGPVVPDD